MASQNSPPVSVRAAGDRGKGLFATSAIIKGDVIFQERPLVSLRPTTARLAVAQHSPLQAMLPQVGIQELQSKLDTSTCANCFTAVGEHTLAAATKPQQQTGQCCTKGPGVLPFARRDGGAGIWRQNLLPDQ